MLVACDGACSGDKGQTISFSVILLLIFFCTFLDLLFRAFNLLKLDDGTLESVDYTFCTVCACACLCVAGVVTPRCVFSYAGYSSSEDRDYGGGDADGGGGGGDANSVGRIGGAKIGGYSSERYGGGVNSPDRYSGERYGPVRDGPGGYGGGEYAPGYGSRGVVGRGGPLQQPEITHQSHNSSKNYPDAYFINFASASSDNGHVPFQRSDFVNGSLVNENVLMNMAAPDISQESGKNFFI